MQAFDTNPELTGSLDDVEIPDEFNLLGVLDLARQILGLTWDYLKSKITDLIGEENMQRLLWVKDQIRTFIDEGWSGFFDQIKDRLSGIRDELFDQIREFVVVRVLTRAVTRLASMLSPVGAVIQLVMTVWDFFQAVREQLSNIFEVVESVFQSLDDIVNGVLDSAKQKVKTTLDNLLPVAIGVVARFLGLGGIPKRIREFVDSLRERIDNAIDALIERIRGLFTGDDDGEEPQEADEDNHQMYIREAVDTLETPPEKNVDFTRFQEKKRREATKLKQTYDRRLEDPIRMTVDFSDVDEQAQAMTFHVTIAPNDEEAEGTARTDLGDTSSERRIAHFRMNSDWAPSSDGPYGIRTEEENAGSSYKNYKKSSDEHWTKSDYLKWHEGDGTYAVGENEWDNDREFGLRQRKFVRVEADNARRYVFVVKPPPVESVALDVRNLTGELVPPKVGLYGELRKNSGNDQQAHHTPPKLLMRWLVEEADTADVPGSNAVATWITQVASLNQGVYEKGKELAAISVHQHTHIRKTGDPSVDAWRIHFGDATANAVYETLKNEGLVLIYKASYEELDRDDKRLFEAFAKEAGALPSTSEPASDATELEGGHLSTQFFGSELDQARQRIEDKTDSFRETIVRVTNGAVRQSHTAVVVALQNSEHDAIGGEHPTARQLGEELWATAEESWMDVLPDELEDIFNR